MWSGSIDKLDKIRNRVYLVLGIVCILILASLVFFPEMIKSKTGPNPDVKETMETLTPKFDAILRKFNVTIVCYDHNLKGFLMFVPDDENLKTGKWFLVDRPVFKQLENGTMMIINENADSQVWVNVTDLICKEKPDNVKWNVVDG